MSCAGQCMKGTSLTLLSIDIANSHLDKSSFLCFYKSAYLRLRRDFHGFVTRGRRRIATTSLELQSLSTDIATRYCRKDYERMVHFGNE